ncbi:hypothetical protein Sjap_017435 [Stephania japonica]|uniref:Uncharacterized protein n=1 Tax=Stephania japonica TaxID=461633 RepID=A0AAP0NKC7_9MAGN
MASCVVSNYAWPFLLDSRDLIGIAKTNSGLSVVGRTRRGIRGGKGEISRFVAQISRFDERRGKRVNQGTLLVTEEYDQALKVKAFDETKAGVRGLVINGWKAHYLEGICDMGRDASGRKEILNQVRDAVETWAQALTNPLSINNIVSPTSIYPMTERQGRKSSCLLPLSTTNEQQSQHIFTNQSLISHYIKTVSYFETNNKLSTLGVNAISRLMCVLLDPHMVVVGMLILGCQRMLCSYLKKLSGSTLLFTVTILSNRGHMV